MKHDDDFDSFFNSIGYGLPENSEELKLFDNHFKSYSFKSDPEKIDPKQILQSLRPTETKAAKATHIDYHKRTVLAAEIVYRLKDDVSLGHLKLQKLMYLCQNAMNMRIHANFLKQAMGPYDPTLMRSLDKQFEEKRWFKFQKNDFPKYLFLEKAGGHEEWYKRYFRSESRKVELLIDLFKSMKTPEVELVATIYACWEERKALQRSVTNDDLVVAVYEWSDEKAKFSSDQILRSIEWMNKNGIVPNS